MIQNFDPILKRTKIIVLLHGEEMESIAFEEEEFSDVWQEKTEERSSASLHP